MTPLQVVMTAFGLWVAWDMLRYVRTGTLRRHSTVFLRWRWYEWAWALTGGFAVFIGVATLAITLMALWPAVFGFTWLQLLATPADGKVEGVNLMAAPARVPWVGLAFLALLMVNVPRLARREEEVFRRGTLGWADGLSRSVRFGLVHCIVGIPIGWGIGLSLGGVWLTWHYFRGGVRRAWFFHVVYNLALLSLLGAWLVIAGP